MKVSRSNAAAAVQRLAETEDGQVFIAYLVAKYGYTRNSTAQGPHTLEMNEGQRTVMVDIGVLLDADPLKLKDMETNDGE
jgi:hypothetical protein